MQDPGCKGLVHGVAAVVQIDAPKADLVPIRVGTSGDLKVGNSSSSSSNGKQATAAAAAAAACLCCCVVLMYRLDSLSCAQAAPEVALSQPVKIAWSEVVWFWGDRYK
jgi:hypothetical protein